MMREVGQKLMYDMRARNGLVHMVRAFATSANHPA